MATERGVQLNRYVAANIRKWRKKRGLTQEMLAEKADIDMRHLQSIEQGKENPTVSTIAAVADALAIRPGLLFRAAEMPPITRGRPPSKKRKQ